jgi:hypothetical protein
VPTNSSQLMPHQLAKAYVSSCQSRMP